MLCSLLTVAALQDYHEQCLYKARRHRQSKSKGRSDLTMLQDRLARIESLLPSDNIPLPSSAQATGLATSSRSPETMKPQQQCRPTDYSISRLDSRQPTASATSPSLADEPTPGNGPPKSILGEDMRATLQPSVLMPQPQPQPSPASTDHSVQLPPTPSLTIATNIGEDDGSCSLPPEQEACPPPKMRCLLGESVANGSSTDEL